MTSATRSALAIFPLAAALAAVPSIRAQEVVELTGRDQRMDPDFEEVFRVGVVTGEDWEMFGTVRNVAFDAEGNLYVFDGQSSNLDPELRVLVFDRSGTFLREFGTAGEGPGEFKMPTSYAVLRDGTTIVGDMGHQAYHIFDPSGKFVRMVRGAGETTQRGQSGGGGGGVSVTTSVSTAIQADPRGGAVYMADSNTGLSASRGDGPEYRTIMRSVLDGEEAQTETVVRAWQPPRGPQEDAIQFSGNVPVVVGADGRSTSVRDAFRGLSRPTTFEPRLLMGLLPDGGLVYSDSSAYALKVAAPDGGLVRTITRPFRPEPVTPGIEEEYKRKREELREQGSQGAPGAGSTSTGRITMVAGVAGSSSGGSGGGLPSGGFSGDFSISITDPPFYHEIPVVRRVSTTWDGTIWVVRQGDELLEDGPIDVVTASGDYVGTYRTGATKVPDAFGPDGVAAFIEFDDYDVASVVVRRLPAGVR